MKTFANILWLSVFGVSAVCAQEIYPPFPNEGFVDPLPSTIIDGGSIIPGVPFPNGGTINGGTIIPDSSIIPGTVIGPIINQPFPNQVIGDPIVDQYPAVDWGNGQIIGGTEITGGAVYPPLDGSLVIPESAGSAFPVPSGAELGSGITPLQGVAPTTPEKQATEPFELQSPTELTPAESPPTAADQAVEAGPAVDTRPDAQRPELGAMFEVVDQGLRIKSVFTNGPLHQMGFGTGDIVTNVNSTPVVKEGDIEQVLLNTKPGDFVPVVRLREGRSDEFSVRLMSRQKINEGSNIKGGVPDARVARQYVGQGFILQPNTNQQGFVLPPITNQQGFVLPSNTNQQALELRIHSLENEVRTLRQQLQQRNNRFEWRRFRNR